MSPSDFHSELNIVKQIAVNNGFPLSVFNSFYKRKFFRHSLSTNFAMTPISDTRQFVLISYFGSVSSKISNFLKQFNLRSAFRNDSSLSSMLVHTKDIADPLQCSGVYKLNCSCGKFYVGRTIRSFNVRFKEHKSQLRCSFDVDIKSAFIKHIVESNHQIPDDCLKPVKTLIGGRLIEFSEMLEISKNVASQPNVLLNEQKYFDNVFVIPALLDSLK